MKELLEKDYNCFQWEGILMGRNIVKNTVIKNGFNQGMSLKKIAYLVNLTPKEVELCISEMQLTRATRARGEINEAN